jgi:hypothetical protein
MSAFAHAHRDPTPVEEQTGSRWWDSPGELRGINLRSWLVLQLADTYGSITVGELVDRVGSSGMRVDGRASKTISDALRWEVLRGRAVRLERGRYAIGRLARSTKHRMRRRLRACRARSNRTAPPIGTDPAIDERPEVRLAREFLTSIRAVAQTRNGPTTPHPAPPAMGSRPPP